ncbi:hypothetical protein FLONG3_7871 [Fusarium longipes]|uniref:Uncharacterized protein n=1 Tax=Fusarium longipes TaxID=694270 RepID=A0A395SAH5_9HYPO|nr:hypothetical protein FLONG3_7871 [Fusarium longipes]
MSADEGDPPVPLQYDSGSERLRHAFRRIYSMSGSWPWDLLRGHEPTVWSETFTEALASAIEKAQRPESTLTVESLVRVLKNESSSTSWGPRVTRGTIIEVSTSCRNNMRRRNGALNLHPPRESRSECSTPSERKSTAQSFTPKSADLPSNTWTSAASVPAWHSGQPDWNTSTDISERPTTGCKENLNGMSETELYEMKQESNPANWLIEDGNGEKTNDCSILHQRIETMVARSEKQWSNYWEAKHSRYLSETARAAAEDAYNAADALGLAQFKADGKKAALAGIQGLVTHHGHERSLAIRAGVQEAQEALDLAEKELKDKHAIFVKHCQAHDRENDRMNQDQLEMDKMRDAAQTLDKEIEECKSRRMTCRFLDIIDEMGFDGITALGKDRISSLTDRLVDDDGWW